MSRFLWSSGVKMAICIASRKSVRFITIPVSLSTGPRTVTSTRTNNFVQNHLKSKTNHFCFTCIIVSMAIRIVALAEYQFIVSLTQVDTEKKKRSVCGQNCAIFPQLFCEMHLFNRWAAENVSLRVSDTIGMTILWIIFVFYVGKYWLFLYQQVNTRTEWMNEVEINRRSRSETVD